MGDEEGGLVGGCSTGAGRVSGRPRGAGTAGASDAVRGRGGEGGSHSFLRFLGNLQSQFLNVTVS